MASHEDTSTSDVSPGNVADSVQIEPRIWRLAPLRDRNPAPPDWSDAGLDVFILGDPDPDGDPVTVYTIDDDARNGLKRTISGNGSNALWVEPSPLRFDIWSPQSQDLNLSGPVGAANASFPTGVWAQQDVDADTGYPLIVTPIVSVNGALLEVILPDALPSRATLTADMVSTLTVDGDDTELVGSRDLFYGQGGSTTIVLQSAVVPAGGSYNFRADLVLNYRAVVNDPFQVAVEGLTVGLQCIEYTSTGS